MRWPILILVVHALLAACTRAPAPDADSVPVAEVPVVDVPVEGRTVEEVTADEERPLAMPTPREGAELLGRHSPAFAKAAAIGEPVQLAGEGAAPVTLVRFWTDTCPYCARSLPAIEAMRADYGERGLQSLAIYHPKPPRPVSEEQVRSSAQNLGYSGPLALDVDWSALREIWLTDHPRSATSVSFLLDAEGRVRFVHPGPQFFPSDDPNFAEAAEDEREMRRAIEFLLAESESQGE